MLHDKTARLVSRTPAAAECAAAGRTARRRTPMTPRHSRRPAPATARDTSEQIHQREQRHGDERAQQPEHHEESRHPADAPRAIRAREAVAKTSGTSSASAGPLPHPPGYGGSRASQRWRPQLGGRSRTTLRGMQRQGHEDRAGERAERRRCGTASTRLIEHDAADYEKPDRNQPGRPVARPSERSRDLAAAKQRPHQAGDRDRPANAITSGRVIQLHS